MRAEIGNVFHWSPKERRESILKSGLVPHSQRIYGNEHTIPYVCLGPSPRAAWALSGDTDWGREEERWDLWQVTLADSDEIRIRAEFGPYIWEIKVHNVIPPDRLWWIGEREPWLC